MNALWQAPVALIVLVTWLTSAPTSLADIAQREALRRQSTPRSASVLTNDDLPLMAPAAVSGIVRPEPTAAAEGTGPGTDDDEAGQPSTEARDEAWWRERLTAARSELETSRQSLTSQQEKVSQLQADFVGRDDPAQREQIRQQLSAATEEAVRLQGQVAADEKAIDAILDEARRAGVPPGWIR